MIADGTLDLEDIREILARVRYRDWTFHVTEVCGTTVFLQIRFHAPDAHYVDVNHSPWSGRKWLLSAHMTTSEIVQTALKAVLTAEEHEAREHFIYDGQAIFGPHVDVDALWSLARYGHLDARHG